MSRRELIDLLTRLIMDGTLTEDEAGEIIDRFDAGELEEGWEIPIAPPAALESEQFYWEEFMPVLVAAQIASQTRGVRPAWPDSPDELQATFERAANSFAARFVAKEITLAEWQARMRDLVTEYTAGQAVMGGRLTTTSVAFQNAINTRVRTQLAYLSRFADNMAMGGDE